MKLENSTHYHRYTDDDLRKLVPTVYSILSLLRKLGYKRAAGASHAHLRRRLQRAKINTSHFTGKGHAKGSASNRRKTAKDILVVMSDNRIYREKTTRLVRALDELNVPKKCSVCGLGETWQDKKITLEIDHINGNPYDNRVGNLRYICPNCHSQTIHFNRKKNSL